MVLDFVLPKGKDKIVPEVKNLRMIFQVTHLPFITYEVELGCQIREILQTSDEFELREN